MLDSAEASSVVAPCMLQEALDLAEQTLRVFPVWHVEPVSHLCCCPAGAECPDPGKHPHITAWQRNATDDAQAIRQWWATWPDANIGLVTGQTNGFVVADFDPRNGGDKTLAELEAANGGPFQTVTALSGGGGVHLFFAVPWDSRLRNGRGIRPGLDRKGNGGYVVCAPSLHESGQRYAWKVGRRFGFPLLAVPDWLDEPEIERGEPAEVPFVLPVGARELARIDRYARRALDLESNAVRTAPKGTRNDRLNEAAFCLGQLVGGKALEQGLVESVLMSAAKSVGLGNRETQATIRSGITAGIKRPRRVPERTPPSPSGAAAGGVANDNEAAKPPKHMFLREAILHAMRPLGPRMSTSFVTLDDATRGGIPIGKVIGLLGAPGAGKTTLAAQWVEAWERMGCMVVFLAADEAPDGIIVRLGQRMGFSREALESADDTTRRAFAAKCADRNIVILDPDADDRLSTIEHAHELLVQLAGDKPRVLLVDSLQTARCDAAEGCDSLREKIDAKLKLLKRYGNTGTLVVAISEMARGAYRTGDRKLDISVLAAGKESGGIEYGVAVLIGLRSVRGEHGLIDVEVGKNRLGPAKPEMRLRIDFATAGMTEIPLPPDEERDVPVASGAKRMDTAMRRVREAVLAHPEARTKRELLAWCDGSQNANHAAIAALITRGELTLGPSGARLVGPIDHPGRESEDED